MQPPDVTVLVTVVKSFPMLVVNECAMHGVVRFIPRMTEHDALVTGAIKIMHRLLAVAARLLALVESLALRHRDVHTVRQVIRLNPSRSLVSAPLALIRACYFWCESSGDACSSPSTSWCHCLPAGSLLRGHHHGGLSLLARSLWLSSLTGFSGSMAVVTISAL